MKKQISPEIFELAKEGEVLRCEKCNHDYFYPIYVLVKIDKLLSNFKKDKVVPIEAYRCANCGHINRNFDPLGD